MFTSFLFANILKEGDFLMGVDKKWGMVFLGEKKRENRFFFFKLRSPKFESPIHSITAHLLWEVSPNNTWG